MRIEILAEFDATCEICAFRDLESDVHHIWYDNLWSKESGQFAVLCRQCHNSIHSVLPPITATTGISKEQARYDFDILCLKIRDDRGLSNTPSPVYTSILCLLCRKRRYFARYDPFWKVVSSTASGFPLCVGCKRLLFSSLSGAAGLKPKDRWKFAKCQMQIIRQSHFSKNKD